MAEFVAAIDQGTTSTRCMIFDHDGAEVARHQLEHEQIMPQAGWVEHNPIEIWERTTSALMSVLNATNLSAKDIVALGITNQRETTLVWNRRTGRPYCNAIVWQPTARVVDPAAWCAAFDAGDPAQRFFAGAVNVRLFNVQAQERESVMDTLGLGALGLPDLQCHFRGLDPQKMARVLYNTAWYVFANGDVIEDGNTVGGISAGSRWKCQHEDSLVGPDRMVLDLDPGAPYAAGNRAG